MLVIAVVAATVVVGLGTVVVGLQVLAGRTDTVGIGLIAFGGIGALCAVIGAATRSHLATLLAGSVGMVIGVVILQTGYTTALGTALIAVIVEVPYLAGFGGGTLLLGALQSGQRHSPS